MASGHERSRAVTSGHEPSCGSRADRSCGIGCKTRGFRNRWHNAQVYGGLYGPSSTKTSCDASAIYSEPPVTLALISMRWLGFAEGAHHWLTTSTTPLAAMVGLVGLKHANETPPTIPTVIWTVGDVTQGLQAI